MSKFVNEIIKDIRTNPETWKRFGSNGLYKDKTVIVKCGNGHKLMWWWATSVVDVIINNISTTALSWTDKYRIEETYIWWMRNASLAMIEE